jgi:hypothetical protein
LIGVGIAMFTSTMFAHVVGTLLFEAASWPFLISSVQSWRGIWQILTITYPFERIAITIVATLLGTGLIKTLKALANAL